MKWRCRIRNFIRIGYFWGDLNFALWAAYNKYNNDDVDVLYADKAVLQNNAVMIIPGE